MTSPRTVRCAGRVWCYNEVEHAWQTVKPEPLEDGYVTISRDGRTWVAQWWTETTDWTEIRTREPLRATMRAAVRHAKLNGRKNK